MKFRSLLLLLVAAFSVSAMPRAARAVDVSFDFFYDSLSPYGEWVDVGDYGYCWRPTKVEADWSPYSDGYWAYTDAGWTWVSYEDYGGIVYHYGRWVNADDDGWCWVPDPENEWAPAWVSWRNNDNYVGWAPLPPEARWRRDRGISVWADASYDIGPSYYSFCRTVDFGAPVLRNVILRRSENFVIINQTVNITNITFNDRSDCIFNGGPDFVRINRFARQPIPALKLVRNTNVTVVNNTIINNNVRVTNVNAVAQGNQLTVVAPRLAKFDRAGMEARVKPSLAKVIPREKVTRGWRGVNPEQRVALRAKQEQEVKGLTPENSPAKAVRAEELKAVPEKADPNAPSPALTAKTRPDRKARHGEADANTPPVNPVADADKAPGAEDAARTAPTAPGAAKIAREKALQRKQQGKKATAADAAAPAESAATANVPGAAEPGAASENADPRGAAKIARERALQQRKGGKKVAPVAEGTPPQDPSAAVTEAPDSAPAAAAVRERRTPGRANVVKPPNAEPAEAAQPPDNARELQRQKAATDAAAAREGRIEQRNENQQNLRERQLERQQKQSQAQPIARERLENVAEQRQQAVEARQRANEQQQNVAAARAQQQAQIARQQAAQRTQVQPPRQPAVQRQQPQQTQKGQPGKGKQKMTPEEAAALQNQ